MEQQSSRTINIRLPEGLRPRLDSLSARRDRSLNALVVQAVINFVEREERREAVRQDCLAAHQDYIHTGLHLTAEEVDAWADQLLAGHPADLPKCHI